MNTRFSSSSVSFSLGVSPARSAKPAIANQAERLTPFGQNTTEEEWIYSILFAETETTAGQPGILPCDNKLPTRQVFDFPDAPPEIGAPTQQPYEQPAYLRRAPHTPPLQPQARGRLLQMPTEEPFGVRFTRQGLRQPTLVRENPEPLLNDSKNRDASPFAHAIMPSAFDDESDSDFKEPQSEEMSAVPPSRKPNRPPRKAIPSWSIYILGVFAVIAVLLAMGLVYSGVRAFAAHPDLSSQTKLPPFVVDSNGQVLAQTPVPLDNNSADGNPDAQIAIPSWQGTERVTVLLMGIDRRREVESEKAYRTDSMMLLTIDPVAKKAAILSLPRDLYVNIPGFPPGRLNTANYLGDLYEVPGGGAALAMQTVEANFGIHVNYYARISFTAFETLIDQIGGIDVLVEETIDDPTYPDVYYGFEPFYIEAGMQHLDGKTALKYARTRHTAGSDFDRAKRQQQVLFAVRDKLTSLNNLPYLIAASPALLQTLADSYDSNMDFGQMAALGMLGVELDREAIDNRVIDTTFMVQDYITPDGQQVIIWDREKVQALRNELFYEPALPDGVKLANSTPLAPEALQALAVQENARIEILNGSGRAGLAGVAEEYLKGLGFNVVSTGNADRQDYPSSVVIDMHGMPYTLNWLVGRMGISPINIFASEPNGSADVRLILGADVSLP